MFYPQNLHTHGVLCDGKNEYEDTVQKAIEAGLTSLGFSGHSYTEYSNGLYCMTEEKTDLYKKEIARLKEKYKDRLEIFCGLEFDQYSTDDRKGYDYIIGTMHYFKFGNEYVTFDRNPNVVKQLIDDYFDGDGIKYAKEYYSQFANLPQYGNFDIVGHFDLITKHSKTHKFFDEDSPAYRKYALDCLHALAEKIDVFEVNTGAVARGFRTTPYPNTFILKEIQKLGCGVTLGSDCHDNRFLTHHFHESAELCKACGFKELQIFTKEGFKGIPLE